MSTPPQVRLHLFHARDAMTSVILRQGPTRLWRMILWDRETDTFQDGQLLRHKVSSGRPTAPCKSEDGLEQVFADPPAPGKPTDFSDHKGKPVPLPQATRDWPALGQPAPVPEFDTDGPRLYRRDPDRCHLIRDVSDMAFEPILAPCAATDAWPPLDEVAR